MQSDRVEYEYRIELLTTELENSSQALQQKSVECEEYRLKSLGQEQKNRELSTHYQMLNKQYTDLSENLRLKVVELEDLKSKYQRMTQITLKDYQDKIEILVQEIEKLNQIIMQRAQDIDSAKQQYIQKVEELQEERQKTYHMENFIKQIKNEKLEALHFLNQKTKDIEGLKEQLEDALTYRGKCSQLESDIEQIRMNYTSLFQQHLEEIQKLKAQTETQRQINDNNMVIAEEKYVKQLLLEKQNIQRELKEKVATSIIQMENQISSLNNLLEAKQNEIEKLKLQRHNLETEKTNSLLIDKNMKLQEFHQRTIQLENQLIEKSNNLEQLQSQIKCGQLIPATSQSLLERQYRQIQEELHEHHLEMSRIQERALELQEELQKKANMKSNYEGQLNTLLIEIANLKRDLMEANRRNSQTEVDQRLQRRIQQLEREKIQIKKSSDVEIQESDVKIRYLLQLLEQKNQSSIQLQKQDLTPNAQQLLQAIIEESNSRIGQSNIFYHEEDSQQELR